MTIKYLSLLILLLGPLFTVAQTLVTGVVTDNNNQPIPLANVFLEDTYDGGMSDENGAFSFETDETGAHTLVVRVIGYNEYRKEVVLAGQPVTVEVRLVEAISQLNAVTISASAFTASDESRRTVFRAL